MNTNINCMRCFLCLSIAALLCLGEQGSVPVTLLNTAQTDVELSESVAGSRSVANKIVREKIVKRLEQMYGISIDASADAIKLSASKPGQSAEGERLIEEKGELYLDASPCEPDPTRKQIKSFVDPYKKQDLDDQKCPDSERKYRKYKVTQEKRKGQKSIVPREATES